MNRDSAKDYDLTINYCNSFTINEHESVCFNVHTCNHWHLNFNTVYFSWSANFILHEACFLLH